MPQMALAVGLTVSLVLTTVFWYPPIASALLPRDVFWRNVASQFADWFFAIILIALVRFGERKPISSLGFKRFDREAIYATLGLVGFFFLGMILWQFAIAPWLPTVAIPSGPPATGTLPPNFFTWFAPFALLTAGFAEEIIYRGYAMERLMTYCKSPLPAIVLPHTAFALMHLKDGFANTIMVFCVGSLFTWFYFSSRNLTLLIAAHLIIDAFAVLAEIFMG